MKKRAEAVRKWTVCAIEGCAGTPEARGFCSTHYRKLLNNGDPLYAATPRTGSAGSNWKGDIVGYEAVHKRATQTLPRQCRACGTTEGRLEVALLHGVPADRVKLDERNGPFSIGAKDYVRLCVGCHRRYDSPKKTTGAGIEAILHGSPLDRT